MRPMRIVHAADLHLDSPLRGLSHYEGAPVDEVRGATRGALSGLVDLCLAEQAAYLLIAGDLYDGDFKDYSTALFFIEQMARLREVGTRVVWLRGNHDAQNRMTRHLQAAEHVVELSTERAQSHVVESDGIVFHGQGYPIRDVKDNLVLSYPEPLPGLLNVGLLHTAVDGRPGHDRYAPCSLRELCAKGYDYWALGHVHQREVLSEEPWVVFPGNLQGRHIKETGPKGCTLIEVDDGRIVSVEHRSVDRVRWALCEVDVSADAELDDALESCIQKLARLQDDAEGRLLSARVRLVGHSRVHHELSRARSRFENELRAHSVTVGGLYLEHVDHRTASAMTAEALSARADALGEMFRAIETLEGDPEQSAALWQELLQPLSGMSAELLENEQLDPREVLQEARRLLEGRLLGAGAAAFGDEP